MTEHWSHFEYTSGANPYIAKTQAERDRIIRKYKRKGIEVVKEKCSNGTEFYFVHDRKGATE